MNPRRRARLGNAALALASLALFLGGAELLARRFDLRPASGAALANPPWLGNRWLLRQTYRDELEKAGLLGRYYDLYEWDRYLFFRLRPHADLEMLDVFAPVSARDRTRWSVHTSSRGFRTDEFDARAAPGVVRVAVLGDSSTFGWGVEQFEAYPERMRGALADRLGLSAEHVEVLNLGVPGYSTFQGRELLERVGLALAPDLVVWSYLSNDGAATGEDDQASAARRAGAAGTLLEVLHGSRAFEALESWIAVARARLRPAAPPDPRDPAQRNVPNYRAAAGNVRAAVEAARAARVPIALVGQCIRGAPSQVMAEVARETGTPFLDATELLDEAIPRIAEEPRFAADRERIAARYGAEELASNLYWLAFLPDGCHPNPLGHRLVGEALADLVAPMLRREGR